MKVAIVTCSSKGGAGIAALRLYYSLQNAGCECAFVSKDLTLDYQGQEVVSSFFKYKKPGIWFRIKKKLQSVFDTDDVYKMNGFINSMKNKMVFEVLSLPFSSYRLQGHPLVVGADMVHFHWMGAILDYPSYFEANHKPLVWTFHDKNPFQGLFHYQADQEVNQVIMGEVDRKVKQIKQSCLRKLQNGVMVSPSSWLMKDAMASGFFSEEIQFKTIPNGIDLSVFVPKPMNETRAAYGIDENEFVLLFVADHINIPRKGAHLLIEALENSNIRITLLTVGKGDVKVVNPLVTVKPVGYINDGNEMSNCYALANYFVLPSLEDNLPNTMLESFACGTPIISFKTGGMAEYIKDGYNGCFAQEMTAAGLGAAIKSAYANKNKYEVASIRGFAEEKFNFRSLAHNYMKVYGGFFKS